MPTGEGSLPQGGCEDCLRPLRLGHVCPPEWEVCDPNEELDSDGSVITYVVRAGTAVEACCVWAGSVDDGVNFVAEYGEPGTHVWVRRVPDGPWTRCHIKGEFIPSYEASECPLDLSTLDACLKAEQALKEGPSARSK